MTTRQARQKISISKHTDVLRSSLLQRKCACGNHTAAGVTCAECGKTQQTLQRRSYFSRETRMGGEEEVSPIVRDVVRSPGQPLDGATRAFMEPRFGHDFSRVRVHTNGDAANSARAMQARAYTLGRDIVFGSGEYAPDSVGGRGLLAHELTHVLQQRGRPEEDLSAHVYVGRADTSLEHEADQVADAVTGLAGTVPPIALDFDAPGSLVRRDPDDASKAKAAPSWTADELTKMLDTCDGGLGLRAKAKKANKDKDPKITPGAGGSTDPKTGDITLDKTQDKCFAVQQLVQELSNLSRMADFDKIIASATSGDLARDDFIKGIEKIEYEVGVKNVLIAFDACKDKWSCKTTPKEWARKAKDFDDYFKNLLSDEHKESYGQWWDGSFKAAFDKKHAKKK